MKSMLSDPKYLVEDYKTEDLFDFTEYVDDLKVKIDALPNKSLLGIIGHYGMGKSTLLEKTHVKLAGDDVIWVHFDAWKYPERTNLWEGFVLDFIHQVAPSEFKKTIQIMDGTSGDAKKKIAKLAGSAINIGIAGTGAVIGKLADFFVTSPAKRVFQIQEVLAEILAKDKVKNKKIYIVIEDADRSGDAGVYFIETLSNFLRTSNFENLLTVFVPIAGRSFTENRDAYVKALDFIDFFEINSRDFTKFAHKIFSADIMSDSVTADHIIEWLQRLIADFKLSFRDIKFIIRNSESKFQALQAKGHKPNPRIVLLIESARYMKDPSSTNQDTVRSTLVRRLRIDRSSVLHLFILSIGQGVKVARMAETINGARRSDNIFGNAVYFVENDDKFIVTRHPIQDGDKYILPTYYLDN